MLKGKWALVTGATAGLGLAVAESLAGAGANIVLHDLVEPKETSDRLRSRFGVDAMSVAADLSQRSSIETMMADLLGRLGAIDILVNNAVVRHFAPVEDFAPERWEEAHRRQSVGAVSSDPPRIAGHEETRLGPHHQHGLGLFDPGRRQPYRLRDDQDRHPRHDAGGCDRDDDERNHL